MTTNKPLPGPDVESAPFWSACKEHRLTMQYCVDCHHQQYPPVTFCEKCRSAKTSWGDVSGRGKVYSWIVVRHPIPSDVFGDVVPYVVALIELEEGPRMASNIVGCDVESITDGMAVEVVFDDVTPEISLPKFRPAGGASSVLSSGK